MKEIEFSNPFVYLRGSNDSKLVTYWVNGDNIGAFTKKDCEHRIRTLCNAGHFDSEVRNVLLAELKSLKRP